MHGPTKPIIMFYLYIILEHNTQKQPPNFNNPQKILEM